MKKFLAVEDGKTYVDIGLISYITILSDAEAEKHYILVHTYNSDRFEFVHSIWPTYDEAKSVMDNLISNISS